MPWAIALRESQTQRIVLWDGISKVDPDDSEYEEDVHIVPFRDEGEMMVFGCHDFTRNCPCQPKVVTFVYDRTQVHHREAM